MAVTQLLLEGLRTRGAARGVCTACVWRVHGVRAVCRGACVRGMWRGSSHRPQPVGARAFGFVHLLEELVTRHAKLLCLPRILLLGHPLRRQLLPLGQLCVELHVRHPFGLARAVGALDAADEEHAF